MISRNWGFLLYILLLFSGSFLSPASAKPPRKFISGIASNAVSALFKWLWSLKSTTKIGLAIPTRSMMKFESGYTVETVFDGSKLGIEPYSVEVTLSGDLLVLDSQNSNIHKVSTPLSRYSVPKFVAGSSEGYSGHVDGKLREARLNHPKGLTVDDRGNIYVADTKNMAIRKISDTGVVTIAGGYARGPGHVDGPSDNAKFSNDFDILYVASTCSVLVVDRGNQAIREIQLHDDDCTYNHFNSNLLSGSVVLSGAVFFGFMLALLQRRITTLLSSSVEPTSPIKEIHPSPYQTPIPMPVKSVRPPLIPPENTDPENEESGILDSIQKLLTNTQQSLSSLFHNLSQNSKKKQLNTYQTIHHQPPPYFNTWPIQQPFIIPPQYPPPFLHPTKKNSHKLTTKNPSKMRHNNKNNRNMYHGHNKHYLAGPETYYEENNEVTNEVVFGAVQEQDGKHGDMLIKAIDYSNPGYGIRDLRSRYNYMGYS